MNRWEEIENAYHGVRDLRGDERTRYLDERWRADVTMRRQVEALLAQDDTPDSFFNRPAVEVATESPSLGRN